ncbi:MAG: hypothetical protein JXX14_21790 [Deltaproteobacteria bacterium]|nr:hypothetical protein [Deltaproteobacteria bacterium]
MTTHQFTKRIIAMVYLCIGVLSGYSVNADETAEATVSEDDDAASVSGMAEDASATIPDGMSENTGSAVVAPPAPMVNPMPSNVVAAPAPAPAQPLEQFYVRRIGQTAPEGPYTRATVEQKIAQKEISHYDEVQTAGTASWSRVFIVFEDAVYAQKPQIEITRRYGIFSSPYRIKVDGKPYSLKRKMKYQGTEIKYGNTYANFEMSGFLYPATREEILKIPEAYRSGKTFPEYFWPSPLGLHMLQSGVSPAVISKREFYRKYAVLPLLGMGVAFMLVSGLYYDSVGEFDKVTVGLLSAGAGLSVFALLINGLSRKKTYRYLKKIETVQP